MELERARQLEAKVNAARKAADIAALVAQAGEAIGEVEELAAQVSGEDRIEILKIGKRIGYNAGADIWPGWEEGAVRSSAELTAGRNLAVRSARFVETLEQGAMQHGNAAWLIGAFDLALGARADAAGRFREAIRWFDAEPEMKLLAEGYLAIATRSAEIDHVLAALDHADDEDARSIRDQLMTARAIYG